MAHLSYRITLLLFYIILTPSMSLAHYCVWGLCESWEYCCGDNECCSEGGLNGLVLVAVILGTLIILALFCGYIIYHSRRLYLPFFKKYVNINYVRMSSDRESRLSSPINQEVTPDYSTQIDKSRINV